MFGAESHLEMRSGLILKIIRILFRYADNASELCIVINK